jgi:hypothetical protein
VGHDTEAECEVVGLDDNVDRPRVCRHVVRHISREAGGALLFKCDFEAHERGDRVGLLRGRMDLYLGGVGLKKVERLALCHKES